VWVKHQSDGLWDDNKLVEGLTGERNIYKRRVDPRDDPNRNLDQSSKKKKRLLFVMDVSASMYRFNGHDRRLQRLVETGIMVCEALEGHDDKLEWAMVGHNGDSASLPFVEFGAPPKDRKARLDMVRYMAAHAQYCWSGDNTLTAMEKAVQKVTASPGEDYFVFVISDANLTQYGYTAWDFARIIKSNAQVHMYCLFIATLGHQAEALRRELPVGHAFTCMDPAEVPHVLKRIFVSNGLLER